MTFQGSLVETGSKMNIFLLAAVSTFLFVKTVSSVFSNGLCGGSRKDPSSIKVYNHKDECAICLDHFETKDMVNVLPCGHVYHQECHETCKKNGYTACSFCQTEYNHYYSLHYEELSNDR